MVRTICFNVVMIHFLSGCLFAQPNFFGSTNRVQDDAPATDLNSRQDDAPLSDSIRSPIQPPKPEAVGNGVQGTGNTVDSIQTRENLNQGNELLSNPTLPNSSQLPNDSIYQPYSAPESNFFAPISAANCRHGQIYASFDSYFLERSGPSPQTIAFVNGTPSLNASSITYDAAFSPGATIGFGDRFGYAWEFNFLTAANHDFRSVQQGTTVTPIFFGGIPAAPVNSYTVFANARLDNYELNCWAPISNRLRVGAGLRIIDVREQFDITETNTAAPTGFFAITDNELYGGQFALQYNFLRNDYANIYFMGNVGPYWNNSKVRARAANAFIAPDSDEFSVVGDLKLVADFPITKILSLRAGYHATFMSRIAQALDQSDDLSAFNPVNPGLIDYSSPSYRGGFVGIVCSY